MTVTCHNKDLILEYSGKTRTRHLCTVPVEHTVDDVLDPRYFGGLAANGRIKVGDIIEVEWKDRSKYGELIARAYDKQSAQLIVAERYGGIQEFVESELPDQYTIVWRGGADLQVLIMPDGSEEPGFHSYDEAAFRARRHAELAREVEVSRKAARAARPASRKATASKPKTKEPAKV